MPALFSTALTVGLVALAVAEPLRPRITAAATVKRQDVPDDCTFFDTPQNEEQDCDYFASLWGISYEDFVAWNPSVGEDCSGIKVGEDYCVERNWGIPPDPTTTDDGGAEPTGGPPSPTQTGIIDTCTSYYQAKDGDDCSKIVSSFGTFTLAEFLEWNKAVGSSCSGLWLGYWYCVGIPGTPTEPGEPDPTDPGDAPGPTQTGIVDDCQRWHEAKSGDDCSKIVAQYGTFNLAEFLDWNPAVGATCSGLWLGYYYCVGIQGTPTEPPPPTGCQGAPDPTQSGSICECKRWHKVASGDDCWGIQQRYSITAAQFNRWNPGVKSDCSGLWLGYNVCVSA
jgi:hypothetical protein